MEQSRTLRRGNRDKENVPSTAPSSPSSSESSSVTGSLDSQESTSSSSSEESSTTNAEEHGFHRKQKVSRDDGSVTYRYRCFCKKFYSTQKMLVNHIRCAELGKVFKCPHCDKRFETHRTLKTHINIIHNIRYSSFGCHGCGKIFESWKDLAMHRKLAGHKVVKLGMPKVGPKPPKTQPLITKFFKRNPSQQ